MYKHTGIHAYMHTCRDSLLLLVLSAIRMEPSDRQHRPCIRVIMYVCMHVSTHTQLQFMLAKPSFTCIAYAVHMRVRQPTKSISLVKMSYKCHLGPRMT
jgi:hypothetical protein